MNYYIHLILDNDSYDVHMRNANIVTIHRNGREILYDDLPLHVREGVLIAALQELAKLKL